MRRDEVRFQTGAPTCPAWLGRVAKAEWRRVAKAAFLLFGGAGR
jgi:phage terminase small subunit